MSMTAQPGRTAARQGATGQSPVPQGLSAVARKFRGLAVGFGADDFVLFMTADDGTPIACMDSDYPSLAGASRIMAAEISDGFVRRMSASTTPCWWQVGGRAKTAGLSALHWAQRIPAPVAAGAGIALPLSADGGRKGFVIFFGNQLAGADADLGAAHWEAFALFASVAEAHHPDTPDHPALSRREAECLRLTAEGLTSDQIADRLGLSVHTANQYLSNATRKLNAVNRIHAVAKALRAGIID